MHWKKGITKTQIAIMYVLHFSISISYTDYRNFSINIEIKKRLHFPKANCLGSQIFYIKTLLTETFPLSKHALNINLSAECFNNFRINYSIIELLLPHLIIEVFNLLLGDF